MTEWDYLAEYQAKLRSSAQKQGYEVPETGFIIAHSDSSIAQSARSSNGAMKWLLPSLLIAAAIAYSLR